MNKFITWMTESFAPKMNKVARNPYISAIQDSILTTMPLIFIGTFATIMDIIREIYPAFPDFGALSTYTFGLLSIFLAFLIPYTIMEKKDLKQTRKQAGLAGVIFFMMIVKPVFADGNIIIAFKALGAGGMIAAIVSGMFVGYIMSLFGHMHLFKEDSAIPDFITVWFDTLIPITLIIVVGWVFAIQLQWNIFDGITNLFTPLVNLGETFLGFVLLNFLAMAFLYSFGISTWVLYPVLSVVALSGIAANADAAAAGLVATHINVYEVTWIMTIGGGGATFAQIGRASCRERV
jgi:PTS system cellobiose-specific IIC component